MFLNSIRWRLQLWHGFLLVLVLAGFGVTAYQLQRATQLRRIDEELQQRLTMLGGLMRRGGEGPGNPPFERFPPPERRPGNEFSAAPRPGDQLPNRGVGEPRLPSGNAKEENVRPEEPEPLGDSDNNPRDRPGVPFSKRSRLPGERLGPPRELHLPSQVLNLFEGTASNAYYYVIWTRDGRILSRAESAPAAVPFPREITMNRNIGPGPTPSQIRMRGTDREMFLHTPPGDCILTGRNIGPELAESNRFAGLLLGAGSAVLVFGLAGGWWLSTRAIRPIKAISSTASKIASGDLSQRIPVGDTENELDQLAGVLNSTFARLEAAFAQQARFTSDAAHELRTPVSVMLTQTQSVLTRERSSAEYRETIEACQRAAQRMRRLTESLLELARLDAGQERMKRDEVDLGQIAGESVEHLRPLATARGISIQSALPLAKCRGDADRLKQVITNLISNAIYYNKDGGEIEVSIAQDDQSAILKVSDTGVGIQAENLPRIFERFWRADQARTHAEGRSGLGLAIAHAIVEVHRGSIEVTSEPDKGSTFTVRLPI